jgi:hypothetical protein
VSPGREEPPERRADEEEELPPPPPLQEFMERSVARLGVEAALGAAGGYVLATVLPQGEGRVLQFALVGGLAAPLALLLTPLTGSVRYRGARYGLALSVVVTLVVSFATGRHSLPVEELLAFGILIFGIGAVGHGVMATALDSASATPGKEKGR